MDGCWCLTRAARNSIRFVIITAVFALHGCSLILPQPEPASPPPAVSPAAQQERNPLGLELDHESTDGERLFVRGRVKAETQVELPKVVLHLTTLKDAEKIGESYFPLSAAEQAASLNNVLPAGAEIPFSMSVASEGMTDYQLELLWGDEAVAFLSSLAGEAEPASASVILEDVALTGPDCEGGKCPDNCYLTASIRNQAERHVESLLIGLSFSGGEEEQIEITSLGLAPASTRPMRLEIDLPYITAKDLDPKIRIIKPGFGK